MKAKYYTIRLLMVLATTLSAQAALAVNFVCTPAGVATFSNRVHLRCSQAYNDGGNQIGFYAISTSNSAAAARALSILTSALVAGRTVTVTFAAGDTAGSSFGCGAADCRRAEMFELN